MWLNVNIILIIISSCCLFMSADVGYGAEIKIGVLANRGPEACKKMWDPTAAYLSSKLHGYTFRIVPLSFDEIPSSVRKEEMDFILVNPSIYVDLELSYGISRIATIRNDSSIAYPVYGGVIFVRSDNSKVNNLKDLIGKRFVAVDRTSLGGWQAAWREFKHGGIDPDKDFKNISFLGSHESVIQNVLDGGADAGTANSDVFAELLRNGKIKPKDFRIIVPEWVNLNKDEFSYPVSTRLYPDWPFSKLRKTSEDLSTKVAIALLSMSPDDEAARLADAHGWSYPLNYQSVHELKKELKIDSYRDYGKIAMSDIYKKHKMMIWLSIFIFCTLLSASIVLAYLYRETILAKNRLRKEKETAQKYLDVAGAILLIIDCDQRVVLLNKRGCNILGFCEEDVIGKNWFDNFIPQKNGNEMKELFTKIITGAIDRNKSFESAVCNKHGEERSISWYYTILMDEDSLRPSVLCSGEDVTERNNLIDRLKSALSEVKTLGGLLPICSHCKSIRDDKGYWSRLEAYISKRTDAEFTHSICPECVKEFYPDLGDHEDFS
ncbi:MAG: PhnD/SsuA/transferrin family substrate-binding protein [Deltaproteobacteria bacterium]|nr:PhnD/SsuA/transferrin family substrate-binding protein [Deltaproteobacteria bacterium]